MHHPFALTKDNLPTLLTWGRIGAIPLFMLVFYLPDWVGGVLSTLVFVAASLTDWLDGYLARKYNVTSSLGRFLDPIADKLLVVTALIMLTEAGHAHLLAVVLIICREIWVAGLREYLGEKQVVVPVSQLAKWKTGVQMAAVVMLLLGSAGFAKMALLGTFALWAAVALTVITGYHYTKAAWPHLAHPQQ